VGRSNACRLRAEPGTFTLTAPTGSGKTLAMLKFALEHAEKHGLKTDRSGSPVLDSHRADGAYLPERYSRHPRIISYWNTTAWPGWGLEAEQRDAEGASERQRRLLAENWDAPIVLTTNVQLLESLFLQPPVQLSQAA
jgi:CRISPR-associated endonuclease/helicase Cas3